MKILGINYYVGCRIRELLKREGLTTQVLAKYLNMSQQQISRYERGVNKIDVSIIYQLSHVFNVDIAVFFEGIGNGIKNGTEECYLNDIGVLTFRDKPD